MADTIIDEEKTCGSENKMSILRLIGLLPPENDKEELQQAVIVFPPELFTSNGLFDFIKEPEFISKISPNWATPGVDTSYFAIRVYDLISPKERLRHASDLKEYVNSLWYESGLIGGFRQNHKIEYPSIHAIHSTLGLLNLLFAEKERRIPGENDRVDCSKYAGKTFYANQIGYDKVEKIIAFLKNCFRSNGSCVDHPDSNKDGTTNTLASALWCLWHLDSLDDLNHEAILGYVYENTVPVGDFAKGIKNNAKEESPWVCTTYYALRSLMTLSTKVGSDYLNNYVNKYGDELFNFVLQAQNEDGGFGASKGELSNLIHTKDALSIILSEKYGLKKHLYNHFALQDAHKRRESHLIDFFDNILKFLDTASCEGVYGFSDKKYFQPNIYATYLGHRIRNTITTFAENLMGPEAAGKYKNLEVDNREKKQIIKFVESCYVKSFHGYRGYSDSSSFLPKEYMGRLEQILS